MFNSFEVPVECMALTEHCAGVNCWFVSWYNALCELYCNSLIYNLHKSNNYHVIKHKTSKKVRYIATKIYCCSLIWSE